MRSSLSSSLLPRLPPLLLLVLLLLLPLLSWSLVTPLSGPPCNVSYPSPINAPGCLLASLPFTYTGILGPDRLAADYFAAPPTVLVLSSNPFLATPPISVFFLNGSRYTTLFSPLSSPYPVALAVDSALGYVAVADGSNGGVVLLYSPYPSYALLAQLVNTGSVAALTASVVPGVGFYLYATAEAAGAAHTYMQNVSVYLLPLTVLSVTAAVNASTLQASAFQVASLPPAPLIEPGIPVDGSQSVTPSVPLSVAVHPVTGELCIFDSYHTTLTLYTANYTNASAPAYNATRMYNLTNSALSTSYGFEMSLFGVSPSGVFMFSAVTFTPNADSPSVRQLQLFFLTYQGTLPPQTSGLVLVPVAWDSTYGGLGNGGGSNIAAVNTPTFASSPDGSVILTPGSYETESVLAVQGLAPTTSPAVSSASLCFLFYALPGTIDFPWSSAISLAVTYASAPLTTSAGAAVQLLSATGSRTYTNRFAASFSTPLSLLPSFAPSLLYLSAGAAKLDGNGIALNLSTPVQLPGVGPSLLFSKLQLYSAAGGAVREAQSSRVDSLGSAVLSSVPGFASTSLGASNINALAANYSACQAPIGFTNGARPPTQPSVSNGAVRVAYSYFLSDGATYSVLVNLTLTASSAFATSRDMLGSPYQALLNATGVRVYTHLPTGAVLMSAVTGLGAAAAAAQPAPSSSSSSPSSATATTASQRFYPYALLSASPGTYSTNTAPFLDGGGLALLLQPAAPALGMPLNTTTQLLYNTTRAYVTATPDNTAALLTEARAVSLPLAGLQAQSYALLQ